MKKTISILGIIISILMIISVLIIYIPTFFGILTLPVSSDEMSPKIMNGSLCFMEKYDNSSLEVGEIIGLKNQNQNSIVRRIVRIKPLNKQMLTKADNLELLDTTALNKENIIGKLVFSIPLLGFVCVFLSTLIGKITYGFVFAIILGLSIYLIVNVNKNKHLANTI